jgi:riboflavin biosynthesis pyrimidine reductase
MQSIPKFKLLLKNPILDNYKQQLIRSNTVQNALGMSISIPDKHDMPFLFSCFATSIDGKLCYPDNQHGFAIAQKNFQATNIEKYADFFWLMLARTISDAIIIGTNICKLDIDAYASLIQIDALYQDRVQNNKMELPWIIIMCRTLDNINFNNEFFLDNKKHIIICTEQTNIAKYLIPQEFKYINLMELNTVNNLSKKNIITTSDISLLLQTFKKIGFKVILNESPWYHHDFLLHKLLDEIWLNYSCSYIGGNVISMGYKQEAFTSNNQPDTTILTLHHINYHFLYLRQAINYNQ